MPKPAFCALSELQQRSKSVERLIKDEQQCRSGRF